MGDRQKGKVIRHLTTTKVVELFLSTQPKARVYTRYQKSHIKQDTLTKLLHTETSLLLQESNSLK